MVKTGEYRLKRIILGVDRMKNKKIIPIIVIAVILIILITIYIFYKNANKNLNLGNNLTNKTNQEIEEYILNISSYEAEIEVEVEGNKNNTKYKIKQSYISPNIEKQTVLEPSNISGLETIYDGNVLIINNTKLNLSTVYQNYPYIADNFLWLNSFIEDYKAAKNSGTNNKLYEENNMVVMEVMLSQQNPYISHKKLFIDKATGKISKLVVQDKNQKNIVYILYNEIKINSLKEQEILAFKLENITIGQY